MGLNGIDFTIPLGCDNAIEGYRDHCTVSLPLDWSFRGILHIIQFHWPGGSKIMRRNLVLRFFSMIKRKLNNKFKWFNIPEFPQKAFEKSLLVRSFRLG
jgi:hypothetical protein